MGNRRQELLETIQKDLTNNELITFYTANNVVFERVDLFRDFVIGLTLTISSTYLGDTLTSAEQQVKHFDWCWARTIANFAEEHIYIKSKGAHYRYLSEYFAKTFYAKEDKVTSVKLILKFWNSIMSYLSIRRQIDLQVFMGLYKMMDGYLVIE